MTADCRYGKMYPLISGAGGEPFFGLGLSVGTEKHNADCIVNEGKEYRAMIQEALLSGRPKRIKILPLKIERAGAEISSSFFIYYFANAFGLLSLSENIRKEI